MTQDLILPAAIYSETHAARLSDKYVHVKTSDVLDIFQDHGWQVASASGAKRGNAQHGRHVLRLRHKDYLEGFRVDGIIPELVVLNSHNGSWALRMLLGMFRTVCANGMVAGTVWNGVTLKHYRLTEVENKIQEATQLLGSNVQVLSDTIEQWNDIEMTVPQQIEFAQQARKIRWGEATPVEEGLLLEARREDDKGQSLWKVYNRVQENLTQGGFRGHTANNRGFNILPIRNVKRDYSYNKKLWDLASTYKEAA